MNVFELAGQYRQLEALVDADGVDEAQLIEAWLSVEGDLNHKLENIGFAIKNREAILAGKQEAIKAMEASAISLEKEIDRLKCLALQILQATGHKSAGGQYLKLSAVQTPGKVEIAEGATLPAEYLREIPPVPASTAPDKKKIADDLKAGVILEGVRLVSGVRLAIK